MLKKLAEGNGKDFLVIIGAGVSKNAGLPLWVDLRNDLVDLLEQHMKDTNSDVNPDSIQRLRASTNLWDTFSELKRDLGSEYVRYIKERLDVTSKSIPDIYKYLRDINIGGVITFNLDRFAINAFSDANTVVQFSHWNEPQKYSDYLAGKNPYVFHAHGELSDSKSWIMTRTERKTLYSNKSFKNFMATALNSKNLLIIGFNPSENSFLELLEQIAIQDSKIAGSNYCILADAKPEEYRKYEEYGISVINYSPDDKTSHSEVVDILKTLRDQRESRDNAIEAPIESGTSVYSESDIPRYEDIGKFTPNRLRIILNTAVSKMIIDDNGDVGTGNAEKIMSFYQKYGLQLSVAWYINVEDNNRESMFHNYRLEEEVNSGSFGKIYRAVNPDDSNQPLAIKVLRQEVNKEIDYLNCFRRGVRAMKFISDSNISGVVKMHKAFEVPNSIVMDYVEGFTLKQAIDKRHINTLKSKLEVIKQVTETILSAHDLPQSVLHRDIKPENIKPENIILENFFSPSDDIVVKIVDFDLAWHRGATEQTVMATGSIGFVAPEQTLERGKRNTRSKAVDVYSIGMLLYYLLLEESPPANYHFSPEFKGSIISKIRSKYQFDWAVLPEYIADTIVDATHHSPDERISLSSFLSRLEIIERLYLEDEIEQTNFILLLELAKNTDPSHDVQIEINQEKSEVVLNQERPLYKRVVFSTESRNGGIILNVTIHKSRDGSADRKVSDYFPGLIKKARSKIDRKLFIQTNNDKEIERSAIEICLTHTLANALNKSTIEQLSKNIAEISQTLQFK